MFDFIRTHQRLMQLVLLVLILPSFVLIGVSGYTNYVSGDQDLVKVGDSAITLQEFDEARRSQLQQFQQNSQGGFDPAILDNPLARKELLESLIDRRVVIDKAQSDRFSVSDTALRQAIASMPQLQVNGQFSAERYNQVLASVGLNTRDFEQSQRAELALDRVLGPVAATAGVPPVVADGLEQILTEQRTVRMLAFPVSDYEKDVVVSEADIQAWYDKNKQSLELPEYVRAQYLLLNEAAAMKNLPAVGQQELQTYYEQNKARYVQPARVNVSHIQINAASDASEQERESAKKKADDISKKVKADPAQFAAIAATESQDAGTAKDGGKLGWITKGSWPANLEEAIFALSAGQVSDVVEGPGSYHIFLANDVQLEQGETFEQARPKIELEVQRQLGADRYADMATRLTGLVYDNPESLQPAADALGLEIQSAEGIARTGLLPSDQVGANAASAGEHASLLDDVRVRNALFASQSYTEKQNSGVIEISPDTMVVVRVDAITPAHVPELAKVQDQIKEKLRAEHALAAAEKQGQEALAALQGNTQPDLLNKFGTPLEISRINPQGLNKPLMDAAFAVTEDGLPQYVGVTGPQGYAIVRIESVEAGKADNAALASLPQELKQAWGLAEQQAVLKQLRAQAKVELLPDAQAVLAGQGDPAN